MVRLAILRLQKLNMKETLDQKQVNLENCAREPIHIINQIQHHGLYLVFDLENGECLQYSENWKDFSIKLPKDLTLGDFLSSSSIRNFQNSETELPSVLIPDFHEEFLKRAVQLLAHQMDGMVIIECMAKHDDAAHMDHVVANSVNEAINKWSDIDDIQKLSEEVVHFVRSLIGFDRVMMYRFDPNDYSGETIAESSNEDTRFLGLRFPASDIPVQARNLYLKNPIRILSDSEAQPVALEPNLNPKTLSNTDMSKSVLRSVSPMHIQYLQNMGVRASMSMSIIVDGQLWGLISCHHKKASTISFSLTKVLKNLAKVVSFIIESILHKQDANVRVKYDNILEKLSENIEVNSSEKALFSSGTSLSDLEIADGWLLQTADETLISGAQPATFSNSLILDFLKERPGELLFSNIASGMVKGFNDSQVGGFMAFHNAVGNPFTLIAYRKLTTQKIKWGGNKHNSDSQELNGYQVLTPRKSFEQYEETVKNKSEGWERKDKYLFEVILDMVSNKITTSNVVVRKEIVSLKEKSARQDAVIQKQSSDLELKNHFLTRKNEELEALINTLSSKLNEPLNQIHINTSFINEIIHLEQIIDRDQVSEFTGELQTAADQMTDTMRELLIELRSVRATSDGMVDGYVIVNNVLNDLGQIIDAYGASISVDDIPKVNMDAKDFYQVMMNLISSALRNSQDNVKPKVSIGTKRNAEQLILFIKDNGVELDEEYKAQMFSVFNANDAQDKMSVFGKGLSDCKKIVEAYNGRIWMESNRDAYGVTFLLSIPND